MPSQELHSGRFLLWEIFIKTIVDGGNNLLKDMLFPHSTEFSGGRAKVSPKPWNWVKAHETGCCYPVGENLWFKSKLTKASPAGQEQTPRAHPAMDVRSWRERGGRPRERAPKR